MAIQESNHLGEKAEKSGSHPGDRREFLRAAAMAGAGLVVGSTGSVVAAVADEPLPLNTPADQLGFTDDEIKLLSHDIKKLTKGDLHDMRVAGFNQLHLTMEQFLAGYKTKGGLSVKVEDIVSLHNANHARWTRVHHAKDGVTVCCCCSPCCCCTASVVTKPLVARVA